MNYSHRPAQHAEIFRLHFIAAVVATTMAAASIFTINQLRYVGASAKFSPIKIAWIAGGDVVAGEDANLVGKRQIG